MIHKRHTAARADGFGFLSDPDINGGAPQEHETIQCVHCGCHRRYEDYQRSGGFCMKCHGPICGRRCEICIPAEVQITCPEKVRITSGGIAVPA